MIATSSTFGEALARHRLERPDRLALAGPGIALSWGQLADSVTALAAALARWRCEPGAPVVLAEASSPLWVAAFLAARAAGLAVVSAGTPRGAAELRSLCREVGAVGVIGDGEAGRTARSVCAELGLGHLRISDPLAATPPAASPPSPQAGEGIAAYHFTSGSTGERKAVPRGEASLVNEGRAIAAALSSAGSPALIVSPVFHSFGAGLLSAAVVAGRPVVLMPSFSVRSALESIERHSVELLIGVPYVFHCLAQMRWTRHYEVGSVRLGVAGGTPLHRVTGERFRERFGVPLVQEYGLSEAGVVAINVDDPLGRPTSVGRALPGLEVRAEPASGAAAAGDPGELIVQLAPDRDPAEPETAETVATGDAGVIDADGFIRITGRLKHMVNVGGVKVAPHDVERRLLAGCELEDVAIVAVPDPLLGERVAAAVVPRAGAAARREDFHAHCRRALAPHEMPRRVLWLDSLPRLESGKPDLQTIRRQLAPARR